MLKFEIAQKRFRHRLVLHHVPLCAGSTFSIAILYWTRPYSDWITRASFATAYPALILLSLTLLLGPWKVLRNCRNPISADLRRDLGIWAAILGILHSAIGQNVHFRARPWLYYVYSAQERHTFPIRHDLFGFSNYTGAVACLLLIVLAATSNDISLRAFGAQQWKQLQRWNYALFALVAAHAIGYWIIEKQKSQLVKVACMSIGGTIALQVSGWLARRSRSTRRIQQIR